MLSRRLFLAASASAVACKPKSASTTSPAEPAAPAPAPDPAAPTDPIACAEQLFGVKYTAEERALMVDTLEEQLSRTLALRTFEPKNQLAPASVFRALLPGRDFPDAPRTRSSRVTARLPKSDVDIAFASVPQLGHWLRTRQITSARLTELYLDRLRAHGPKLRCVVTLTEDRAREEAAAADAAIRKGRVKSPVHGIPYGAKDLFDSEGHKTTWGATLFKDRVASRDAAVVTRLREAGAVLAAKTTLGALAYGDLWFDGITRNPWNPAEGSSGSSAGSASATAAGLVGFALGTETLGSIVSPSMRCGTAGLRPTFGRVSRDGAMALCWSLDKVGPVTRTVEGAAAVLGVIAGPDTADPATVDAPYGYDARATAAGLRVGYDEAWFEGAEALDREALESLKAVGVELVAVKTPDLPYEGLMSILFAEAAAAFEDMTLSDRDDRLRWQGKNAWPNAFRAARFISAVELTQATRLRRAAMEAMDRLTADVDALISPSFGGPLLVVTNYTGHPSLTVRVGFQDVPARPFYATAPGLPAEPIPEAARKAPAKVPHGITLWGKPFREDLLIRLGRALEAARDVWAERPPL